MRILLAVVLQPLQQQRPLLHPMERALPPTLDLDRLQASSYDM
jgi:hypothetical protein